MERFFCLRRRQNKSESKTEERDHITWFEIWILVELHARPSPGLFSYISQSILLFALIHASQFQPQVLNNIELLWILFFLSISQFLQLFFKWHVFLSFHQLKLTARPVPAGISFINSYPELNPNYEMFTVNSSESDNSWIILWQLIFYHNLARIWNPIVCLNTKLDVAGKGRPLVKQITLHNLGEPHQVSQRP